MHCEQGTWIELAQDRVQRCVFLSAVSNLQVLPIRFGKVVYATRSLVAPDKCQTEVTQHGLRLPHSYCVFRKCTEQ